MSLIMTYWFLPILFIIHDFEEIIMMPLWKQREARKLEKFKIRFFGAVTDGSAFSIGVLEELLLLVLVLSIVRPVGINFFI